MRKERGVEERERVTLGVGIVDRAPDIGRDVVYIIYLCSYCLVSTLGINIVEKIAMWRS